MKSIIQELYSIAVEEMRRAQKGVKSDAFWECRDSFEKTLSEEQKKLFSEYEKKLFVEELKEQKNFFLYGLKKGKMLYEELES